MIYSQPQGGGQPIVEVDGKIQFGLPGKPIFDALDPKAFLKPTPLWRRWPAAPGRGGARCVRGHGPLFAAETGGGLGARLRGIPPLLAAAPDDGARPGDQAGGVRPGIARARQADPRIRRIPAGPEVSRLGCPYHPDPAGIRDAVEPEGLGHARVPELREIAPRHAAAERQGEDLPAGRGRGGGIHRGRVRPPHRGGHNGVPTQKPDASPIESRPRVPAGGEAVITYTVHYSW